MEKSSGNKSKKYSPLWLRLIINLAIMALVAFAIAWGAMCWLDVWTDHGNAVTVPQVKGLSYYDAEKRLHAEDLLVEVADSVYDNHTAPGTVLEQNPKVNTKVKPKRVVFLTINAFSPKTVTIPTITDISLRQAKSILEGLGIKNIKITVIPSDFKDLVLDVRYKGARITPGARIPVNGTVELHVGEGPVDMTDSVDAEGEVSETPADVEQLDLF